MIILVGDLEIFKNLGHFSLEVWIGCHQAYHLFARKISLKCINYVPSRVYVSKPSFKFFDSTFPDRLSLASPLNFLLNVLLATLAIVSPSIRGTISVLQVWSFPPILIRNLPPDFHSLICIKGIGKICRYGIGGTPVHQGHGKDDVLRQSGEG